LLFETLNLHVFQFHWKEKLKEPFLDKGNEKVRKESLFWLQELSETLKGEVRARMRARNPHLSDLVFAEIKNSCNRMATLIS